MIDLSHWNVLIVDDEPDHIGLEKHVFRYYNAHVRTAASAMECLERLKEQLPTVLFTDIQMPKMSGEDLLKIIRANAEWQHLKVIVVSARVIEGDRDQFLGQGFDGYIPKPISADT